MGRVHGRDAHSEIALELRTIREDESVAGTGLRLDDVVKFEPQLTHVLWKIDQAWQHSWADEEDGQPFCVGEVWYGSGGERDGRGGLRFMIRLLTGPNAKVEAPVLRSRSAYLDAAEDAYRRLPPCGHPDKPCSGRLPIPVISERRGF